MTNMKGRRRHTVCTAVLLGAILIGCSCQPNESTKIIISATQGTEASVTVERPVEATRDTIPTESTQVTESTDPASATEDPMAANDPPKGTVPETRNPTKPAQPPATEPTTPTTPPITTPAATQPPTTEPSATVPPTTEPPTTEPPTTVPPTTKPPTTEPPATELVHTHSYTITTVDSTCAAEGYILHACDCGYSYKESNGQGWVEHSFEMREFVDATPEADGYVLEVCTVCGYELKTTFEYTGDPTEPAEVELDPHEVAAAVAKYINRFRSEQGAGQLTWLPGLSQVAQYRSRQLVSNYAHDTVDIRAAYAYYQYGEYIDMTVHGLPESESYYTAYAGEAIGYSHGSGFSDADSAGEAMARGFLDSTAHWEYVGDPDNLYIGVGCTKSGSTWYVCVLVSQKDYG